MRIVTKRNICGSFYDSLFIKDVVYIKGSIKALNVIILTWLEFRLGFGMIRGHKNKEGGGDYSGKIEISSPPPRKVYENRKNNKIICFHHSKI